MTGKDSWVIRAYDIGSRAMYVRNRHGDWTNIVVEGAASALRFDTKYDAEEFLIQMLFTSSAPIWEDVDILRWVDSVNLD